LLLSFMALVTGGQGDRGKGQGIRVETRGGALNYDLCFSGTSIYTV